ncbi:hypothetical protein [Acidovorax sp. Leaf73]|uniref:hypothetical protein n=1 Tax=Acidovorax sp. Leaf73 TaxID=2876566 RepID=UPI001E5A9B8F|nr:hypothetical protein [Acidovorax sp. Leaf73]
MTMDLVGSEPALTRRAFGVWGLAAATTGIAGCGGGGGGDDSGGGAEPPLAAGLYQVAGVQGGSGFAVWQGEMKRLPMGVTGLAFNRQGDLQFVGSYYSDFRLGRKPKTGASSFTPLASESVSGHVFDALDRYLVTLTVPSDLGRQVAYMQAGAPVVLAGGASSASLKDGRGAAASINHFMHPLLAGDGLVYFVDLVNDTSKAFLRSLSTDGVVTTLLEVPYGTVLLESPTGGVRRFSSALYPAVLTEWADLVNSGGAYTWQPVANQWPFDRATPLVKVPGTAEVYWAVANSGKALAQIDLAGRWLATGWNLPGPLASAAVDRTIGSASGTLLYVAYFPQDGGLGEDGVEIVQCRLEMPSTVVYPWLGLAAHRGAVDGQPEQARFSFLQRTDAVADGAGGLILLEYERTVPGAAIRTVSSAGQVATWPTAPGGRLLALAYGHVVSFDAANKSLVRTPKDGLSAWKTWASSDLFASNGFGSLGVEVLRTDPTGLLWFTKRYRPLQTIGFPPGSGSSLVGTVDEAGQVRVVAGDPQALYTPLTYPPLAQRPWYFDITDMAFEGGPTPVSWILCNRVVLDDAGKFVRFHPELVRIDPLGRQAYALPAVANALPVLTSTGEPYTHLCVLADRPGEVFISSHCNVYRWTQAKGMEVLAGQGGVTPGGVLPGLLPGDLNVVKFLVPGPDRRSLYVGSENSVLKLVLAN